VSGAGSAALMGVRRRLAIRGLLATTQGRLRTASVLLALGAFVLGTVAADAARTRRHAVADVASTERLLVSAVDVSAAVSDAHATAASSFLVGGPEPAASRVLYAVLLGRATAGVARLAGEIGALPAVRAISRLLAVYAGLVESARANYRQGFSVGSAYLRRATQMRDAILRQGRALYAIQARRLTASFTAGRRVSSLGAVALAGCSMLALLAVTQLYLARATRRIVNPGLALATVVLLAVVGWVVLALAQQQRALTAAQTTGSDPLELLTATRILALRAEGEESIALTARGGGEGEPDLAKIDTGFAALTGPIGRAGPGPARDSGGLLEAAARIAGDSARAMAAIDAIDRAYDTYVAAHRRVAACEKVGDFGTAVDLALGKRARRICPPRKAGDRRDRRPLGIPMSTTRAAAALNCLLIREIDSARGRFDRFASRAGAALGGLGAGIPLLTGLCGLLALLGVRERLKEYR
jgi:hypothetical protein